jgi:hypothetical protein
VRASQIYLKAAQLIEIGTQELSCCAVSCAYHGEDVYCDGLGKWKCPARDAYNDIFNDSGYTSWPGLIELPYEERKPLRVLLLCLMSAIAADDERNA